MIISFFVNIFLYGIIAFYVQRRSRKHRGLSTHCPRFRFPSCGCRGWTRTYRAWQGRRTIYPQRSSTDSRCSCWCTPCAGRRTSRRTLKPILLRTAGSSGSASSRTLSLLHKVRRSLHSLFGFALSDHWLCEPSSGFLNCVVYGLSNQEVWSRYRWWQHLLMIIASPFIVLPIIVLASLEEILRVAIPSLHARLFRRQYAEVGRFVSLLSLRSHARHAAVSLTLSALRAVSTTLVERTAR